MPTDPVERAFLAGGEMGRRIVAFDWAATPLGPLRGWPAHLRTAVSICLASRHPMVLCWGPDLVLLYNDAWIPILGPRRHPAALGRAGRDGWPQTWHGIGEQLAGVLETGEATWSDDQPLPARRHGDLEEAYFTYSCSPVQDETGAVAGVLTVVTETTSRVLSQRRPAGVSALGGLSAVRSSVEQAPAELRPDPADGPADSTERERRAERDRQAVRAQLDESDRAFRLLAEHADDLIGRHATDGTWLYLSPSLRRITGHRPEDLIGRHPRGFAHPDDVAVVEANLARLDAGESITVRWRFRRADGDHLWLDTRARPVVDERTGRREYHCANRDVTEQVTAEHELFAERERYRTLVAQAPVGIFLTDTAGAGLYVNERSTEIFGRGADELLERGWVDLVHPEDDAAGASWRAAVAAGEAWQAEYRLLVDGVVRWVRTSARPLHDAQGGRTGYLGVVSDVTEQRDLEDERRRSAAEHAAREVSDAAAARLRSMVDGLAAVLWEADARSMEFTFVSDRAEELLGHPTRRWLGDAAFWPSIIHPDDRDEAVRYCAEHTAAGEDHDFSYRVLTAEGRVLWVHDVVHVVCDAAGEPVALQGVMVEVTAQKRAERSATLLAEAGRLLSGPEAPEAKLGALARLLVGEFGDAAVVAVSGPDGLFHRLAVAHPAPEVADRLMALAPNRLPEQLYRQLLSGRPLVVPVSEELNLALARDEADLRNREELGAHSVLVVPLVADDDVLGMLSFPNLTVTRGYDDDDLALAEELGRRAAGMVSAHRRHRREHHLQQLAGDLASAGTLAEVAGVLVALMAEVLDSASASVYVAEPDGRLRILHALGYPPESLAAFAAIRPDDDVPLTACVRTGEPVLLRDLDEIGRRYPHLLPHLERTGNRSAAALPLRAGGRIIGTLGLSFATPRRFARDEREFMLALVAQAAPAFERALVADQRREVAETLQQSLLPKSLPRLPGLALAAHYLPGAAGVQAGGDWFDVLPLDENRVAIAVGDVVGQGAAAAAVMGQLRSALAAYLLEGHGPGAALDRLNTYARTVDGSLGSTAACLVLDHRTSDICWAGAGHPPPLVVDAGGARFLDGAGGTVLGLARRPSSVEKALRLGPGASVVLYTDGLVERRGESIDAGLRRLADVTAALHAHPPAGLAARLLTGCLTTTAESLDGVPAPVDDVALIVARILPPPLDLSLPARPELLRGLRAEVAAWAAAAGLAEDTVYDLQLALGEAVANAVEHAYRDVAAPPGTDGASAVAVRLAVGDSGVEVRVRDRGRWREPPGAPGPGGRGLELIRAVGAGVDVARGEDGTEVRFTVPVGEPGADSAPPPTP
ncbi:MAG TPA: PAS domain S-box protein, partial [Pseudonocardia sp.]|nr:PAS domain S-box protein [Pseudonocardia sp.]